MGITAEEQRSVRALLAAVLTDRLRRGGDVVLVERAAEARTAVTGRAEGHALVGQRGIRVLGEIGGHEVWDVDEIAGLGGLAGAWITHTAHHCRRIAFPGHAGRRLLLRVAPLAAGARSLTRDDGWTAGCLSGSRPPIRMRAWTSPIPPEAEAFRKEIRAWLEEHLPDGWFEPGFEMSDEDRTRFNEEWPEQLYAGGWICATWPTEYGGKGLSTMEGVVLAEEFARARAPMRADFFGDTLVGPTILQWGTEEQKREFLPKILRGQVRWCQGFSEPDSGSDLASLKTSAVLDGDEWVINGQKVWTTGGHHADYCFLLTRTDPDAPKHKGISYLLVPMRQSGVEVRNITQPDGTAEFCEVFFSDARCPRENVVGGVNNGWKVANSTLAFERGQSATTGYRRFEEELRLLIEAARRARAPRRAPDPAAARGVLHEGADPARQRVAVVERCGLRGQGPGRDGARSDEQDVLVRDAPAGDGARPRHLRSRGDADRCRPGHGLVAGRAA